MTEEFITDVNGLEETAVRALLAALPQSTKDAIDAALTAGLGRGELIRRVARQSGNRQSLITLAVEEYLRQKHGWFGPAMKEE
jgi:spermidine synthase